jgi:large repetitive protein
MRVAGAALSIAALVVSGALGQTTPGTPSAELSALRGFVLDASTGRPLGKATLQLKPAGPGKPASASATADDRGRFAFEKVQGGIYWLSAEAKGFPRQFYGSPNNPLARATVLLKPGVERTDLRFALTPGATISGRVTTSEGEPLKAGLVAALNAVYAGSVKRWAVADWGQVSSSGSFRIPGLPAGEYILAARRLERPPDPTAPPPTESDALTFFLNATDASGALPFTLALGARRSDANIRLGRSPLTRLDGKVVGLPEGQEAEVTIAPEEVQGLPAFSKSATTSGGAFSFTGLTRGNYALAAKVGEALAESRMVRVAGDPVEDTSLGFRPGGLIRGTISAEDGKTDVRGIQVNLRLKSNPLLVGSATAQSEGELLFTDLPPGAYAVEVTSVPANCYVKYARFRSQPDREFDVSWSGDSSDQLELSLGAHGAGVSGVVRGKDDALMVGATVVIIPDSRRWWLYRAAASDQNGAYLIQGLAPGEYTALAWQELPPSAYLDPEFVRPFENDAVTVSLVEGGRGTANVKGIAAGAQR